MKRPLFFFFLVATFGHTIAQGHLWSFSVGNDNTESIVCIASDANGNTYAAGRFADTVDFDPGPGVFELVSHSPSNIFVQKTDAAGNLVWAKSFRSNDYCAALGSDVDANGNLYIAGYFVDSIDFDPGPGTAIEVSTTLIWRDACVIKLDPQGNLLWYHILRGDFQEMAYDLKVSPDQGVVVTGTFMDTVDFDNGPGVTNLTATNKNICLYKLNANGDLLWANTFEDTGGDDNGEKVNIDQQGNIYLSAMFTQDVDFDPGPGQTILSANSFETALVKFDTAGSFLWARHLDANQSVRVWDLVMDANGDLYTTGFWGGNMDIDLGPGTNFVSSQGGWDAFVHKISSSGSMIWSYQYGGVDDEYGRGLEVRPNGDIWVTGSFEDIVDFDPGPGTLALQSAGGPDGYLLQVNSSGTPLWAGRWGGSGIDGGMDIEQGPASVLVSGYFSGTSDMDLFAGGATLVASGDYDGFLAKYADGSVHATAPARPQMDLTAWPNPTSGSIELRLEGPGTLKRIQVLSLTGQEIHHLAVQGNYGEMDLSTLPAGSYLLQVHGSEGVTSLRILKM